MRAIYGIGIVVGCYLTAAYVETAEAKEPIKIEIKVKAPKLNDIEKARVFTKQQTAKSNELLDILYSPNFHKR